mmetsp:Transcript_57019/g.138898  ORF Transcript_57019/g.138898 Transcript_57019/m.138898 type:complete len:89 (-) Transcript_57019:691-957(-)
MMAGLRHSRYRKVWWVAITTRHTCSDDGPSVEAGVLMTVNVSTIDTNFVDEAHLLVERATQPRSQPASTTENRTTKTVKKIVSMGRTE